MNKKNFIENNVQEATSVMNNQTMANNNGGANMEYDNSKKEDINMNNNSKKEDIDMNNNTATKGAVNLPKYPLAELGLNYQYKNFPAPAQTDGLALPAGQITVRHDDAMEFEKLMPECEKEVQAETRANNMEKIRNLGFFSPAKGMAHIENALGGMFSARVYEAGDGKRYVEYVQQYSNGAHSPIMRIPQTGLKIAVKHGFEIKGKKDAESVRFRKIMEKSIADATDEYYGKFRGPGADEQDIKEIMTALCRALDFLPTRSDLKIELTGEKFYHAVVHSLHKLTCSWFFDNYDCYYPLEDTGLNDLAMAMGMTTGALLKQLRDEGFLYLTPSSKGYQTNVRIKDKDGNSYTEWMYCIWKLTYFAGVEEEVYPSCDNF